MAVSMVAPVGGLPSSVGVMGVGSVVLLIILSTSGRRQQTVVLINLPIPLLL